MPKKKTKKVEKAIVKIDPVREKPWLLNTDEVAIVKNSIAKGASDQELTFLLTVARRYRLDPFRQQIWFVRRWDKNADNGHGGTGAYVWTPQVGINGLLFAAGRDHKEEFGSVSEPEYGPMVEITKTLKAPEWARVQVWKRGIERPTVGIAYWEEYAPWELDKAPFWRKMPRRMLGKCATALAIRQAYPDLGGLYIPEECDRMNEDYTPGGRRIVQAEVVTARFDENAPHGHAPGSPQALMAEAALRRSEEEDRKLAEAKKAAPSDSQASIHPDLTRTSDIPVATAVKPLPDLPVDAKQVVVDWHDKDNPIVTGDSDAIEGLKPLLTWGPNDFWHVKAADAVKIGEACAGAGYRFAEILPETTSGRSAKARPEPAAREGSGKPKATTAPAAESAIVKGTIERVNPHTTPKGKLMAYVTINCDGKKSDYSSWDKDINEELSKHKGQVGEVYILKNGTYLNLVGLKVLGSQEYIDGKVPVIQQKTREAGMTPGLFGG